MKNGVKCLWDNKNAYLCTMVVLKLCGGSFDRILLLYGKQHTEMWQGVSVPG